MIYLVSGVMRSGTSMMMKALKEGGMEPAYRRYRDEYLNKRWGEPDEPNGYRPNEEYFELARGDFEAHDFPNAYEGKVVKCLWNGSLRVNVCDARIIFMRRPQKEIVTSCMAAFGHAPRTALADDFDLCMDRLVSIARDRRSFKSVSEIWYEEVLSDPLAVFRRLADEGWPVLPEKAAAIPKPSRKRYVA